MGVEAQADGTDGENLDAAKLRAVWLERHAREANETKTWRTCRKEVQDHLKTGETFDCEIPIQARAL